MAMPGDACWPIFADCGDHYCEREHLVAIAVSFDDVPRLVAEAQAQMTPRRGLPPYPTWYEVFTPKREDAQPLGKLVTP